MSILTRSNQKIFGILGGASDFGQIGSKAAGSPLTTKNIETMQALAQYDQGLTAIVSDQGSSVLPYLEDMNSLFFLTTSQLSYLMQSGIAEWDDETEYYKDISLVLYDGNIFIDTYGTAGTPNLNFDPATNLDKWRPISIDSFLVDTGAADAYVVDTIAGTISSAYYDGMRITFKPANTNTGASTINVSSIGAKSIVNYLGNALIGGELQADFPVDVVYDLANDRFYLASLPGVIPGTAGGINVVSGGIVSRSTVGSGAISRTDAQIEIGNGGIGHALISINNEEATGVEEGAISFQGKRSDGSLYQQLGFFVVFVNDDNTLGAYNSAVGMHVVGSANDKTPFLIFDNNSVVLSAGDTSALPWDTLPKADSLSLNCITGNYTADFQLQSDAIFNLRGRSSDNIASLRFSTYGNAIEQFQIQADGAGHLKFYEGNATNLLADFDGANKRFGIGRAPTQKIDAYAATGSVLGYMQSDLLDNGGGAYWQAQGKKASGLDRYASIAVIYNNTATSDEACGVLTLYAGDGQAYYIWVDDSDVLKGSKSFSNIGTSTGTTIATLV